jgi:hypothetical protein
MNNSILTSALHEGEFLPPSELVSLPPSRSLNSRAWLWALTLLSFLGGTYYGYQFRKTAAATDAQLVIVARDGLLVAQWDGNAPGLAALESAQLRVRSGGKQLLLPMNKAALRGGELALSTDPGQPAEVELFGQGITGHARFLAGDPLDSALVNADADSLKQQLADQQDLNQRMERQLAPASR